MKHSFQFVLLAVAMLLGTMGGFLPAWANEDIHGACQEDAQKYCSDIQPGQGRILNCLSQQQLNLSTDCQSHMSQMKERMHETMDKMKACQADKEKFCKDVRPGEGRIIRCLSQHHDELTAECQKAIVMLHKKRHHDEGDTAGKETLKSGPSEDEGTEPGNSK